SSPPAAPYFPDHATLGGLPRPGSCCTDQLLPSGSLKNTNEPHGKLWTSPTSTPPSTSAARASPTSATTSWSPRTLPGGMSERPVPMAIEQADPGGVSWTKRRPRSEEH